MSELALGKRVASATVWLVIGNAASRMLSFVTLPILTHLLSPAAYGTSAMIGSLIALISVVALAGLDMSYMRTYPSKVPPSGQSTESFVWRTAAGIGIVSAGAAIVLWPSVSGVFKLDASLGIWVGVGVFASMMNAMAQTRARLRDRYRMMAFSIVTSGVVGAVLAIGVAYYGVRDETPLLVLLLMSFAIPVVILGFPRISQLVRSSGLHRSERWGIFNIGLAGIFTAPAFWVLSSSDRWFLGYFGDTAAVGVYAVGYSVAVIGMMVNSGVQAVWTPETTRLFEDDPAHAAGILGGVAERLVAAYACVWLAITAAGGDIIRMLAAPAFHGATSIVPSLAGAIFFHGIYHLWNANLLVVKRLGYAAWWRIGGAVVCVSMNILLIPVMGITGAAITQLVSAALVAGGIVVGVQKICPMHIEWKRIGIVVGTIIALGMGMHHPWAGQPLLSLLSKLPVGMLAVGSVVRFIAPETFSWLLQMTPLRMRKG